MSLGIIVPHNVYQYKRHSLVKLLICLNTLQITITYSYRKGPMEAKVTKAGSMEAKGNVDGVFLRQNLKDSGRNQNLGAM